MENWIKTVRIQNFKSVKDVSLKCERINIFVGKPNVGKSNLLEGLSLLGLSYEHLIRGGLLNFVRLEQTSDLFFDQNIRDEVIKIEANEIGTSILDFKNNNFEISLKIHPQGSYKAFLSPRGEFTGGGGNLPVNTSVKYYRFSDNQTFKQVSEDISLQYPFGENLLTVLQTNKQFRLEVTKIFEQYGLELLLDAHSDRLDIVKRRDGLLFKTPFALVADTLRRYMFHLAAIESNRNSILLFEEPESHNYPPYITQLAHRILLEETNQYFITTHSPFLFNTLVEEAKDLAVFMVEYEDFQTKVRRLSEETLREILDYGLNIFTEHDSFV